MPLLLLVTYGTMALSKTHHCWSMDVAISFLMFLKLQNHLDITPSRISSLRAHWLGQLSRPHYHNRYLSD